MGAEAPKYIDKNDNREPIEDPSISFDDFRHGVEAEVGMTIRDIPPQELFTYQEWIDVSKIANVMRYVAEDDPRLNHITGFIHHHSKFDKDVMVIGNGNHRALYALVNSKRVNMTIEKRGESGERNPFRLTNLRKKYGDVFH